MKPYIHAVSSAKRFGGVAEDYLAIHNKMDSSKSANATHRHRAVFHSAFGIFIIEDIFGVNITNSEGKLVSTRDIAEQHVIEDLGFIPTLSDWLNCMEVKDWMGKSLYKNKEVKKLDADEVMKKFSQILD